MRKKIDKKNIPCTTCIKKCAEKIRRKKWDLCHSMIKNYTVVSWDFILTSSSAHTGDSSCWFVGDLFGDFVLGPPSARMLVNWLRFITSFGWNKKLWTRFKYLINTVQNLVKETSSDNPSTTAIIWSYCSRQSIHNLLLESWTEPSIHKGYP